MKIDFKAYLQKLQNLSEDKKKIILWAIIAVLAVIMGLFWARGAMNSLSKIGESAGNIKLPEFGNMEFNSPGLDKIADAAAESDTATWKTYTNFGIEFKYPNVKEWGEPQERVSGSSTEISFGGYWAVYILSNYNNETGKIQTFDELVKTRVDSMKVLGGPPYDITEEDISPMVSVNGIEGKVVSYRNKGSNPNFDIYYPADEHTTVMFENNNSSVSDDIFNGILSTFKFTK